MHVRCKYIQRVQTLISSNSADRYDRQAGCMDFSLCVIVLLQVAIVNENIYLVTNGCVSAID